MGLVAELKDGPRSSPPSAAARRGSRLPCERDRCLARASCQLILWAGIGEAQKLAVFFIGSFSSLVLTISVTVGNTRRDLVAAAHAPGVKDTSLIRRVLIPGAAPEIAEQLRMGLGWAWACVTVAELIGASSAGAAAAASGGCRTPHRLLPPRRADGADAA